uniref:Phosphatidylethanolamine binding protein n=1 Tax=Rhipicephalus zambeziensis TaxID=60191 RepID=A0A224YVP9_9ACAR
MQFVQHTSGLLLLMTSLCCDGIRAQDSSNMTNMANMTNMTSMTNATMVEPPMPAVMTTNMTQPQQQQPSASIWTTEELVTDLSLPGAPNATLDVRYTGSLQVTLGNKLTPQQASTAPTVCLRNVSVDCEPPFALLMVDPDATSRQDPKFRSWLHWIVVNVNSTEKLHEGDQAVPYNGPAPPKGSGPHRYVFLLYCQRGRRLQGSELAPEKRNNFNLAEFVNKTELGPPLAGNFFFAENP